MSVLTLPPTRPIARKTRRDDEDATFVRYNCGFVKSEFFRSCVPKRRIRKQDDGESKH